MDFNVNEAADWPEDVYKARLDYLESVGFNDLAAQMKSARRKQSVHESLQVDKKTGLPATQVPEVQTEA